MIKKNILFIFLIIIFLFSSNCFATETEAPPNETVQKAEAPLNETIPKAEAPNEAGRFQGSKEPRSKGSAVAPERFGQARPEALESTPEEGAVAGAHTAFDNSALPTESAIPADASTECEPLFIGDENNKNRGLNGRFLTDGTEATTNETFLMKEYSILLFSVILLAGAFVFVTFYRRKKL